MTKGDFEENLRRSMMIDKLRSALTDWMAVSDADLEREYKTRNEKVKLQVVALTADKFRDKVTVNDADVASYYDAHKAEYRKGEQRKVRYLLLDRDQLKSRVTVSPQDVEAAYNANIQQYQTPEQVRASHILLKTDGKDEAAVRKQAEDILKQVKAPGADFAALAKKYSEDEGSKATGGDLDYFSKGRMVPEFESAAFAMQPGQISDLVKSQFGFHIIKVVDKKPASHAHPRRGARADPGHARVAARRSADRGSHARPRHADHQARRPRRGGEGVRRDGRGIGLFSRAKTRCRASARRRR